MLPEPCWGCAAPFGDRAPAFVVVWEDSGVGGGSPSPSTSMSSGAATVLGEVAVHARVLRGQARREWLLGAGLTAGAVALFVAGFLAGARGALLLGLGASALVAGGFGAGMVSRARVRLGQTRAGIRAEQIVGSRLEKLPVTAVVHNVDLGRGDVDHVVLGPVCVAVETKYGQGSVRIEGDRLRVGAKLLRGSPLRQARQSAQLVARALGVPCMPLVVVSGGTGPAQLHAGVWVASPDTLASVVSALPHVVDPVSAHDGAVRLHRRSQELSAR